MPAITNTYALAYDVCDAILIETGKFPTIDAIRERIGVNSPNTIKKAINQWTANFAQKHYESISRPGVPSVLIDMTEQLWRLSLKSANDTFNEQRNIYIDQIKLLEENLSLANGALNEQIIQSESLKSSIDDKAIEIKELTLSCDSKSTEIINLTHINNNLRGEINTLTASLGEAIADAKSLSDRHDAQLESMQKAMQEQNAFWQNRYDVLHQELNRITNQFLSESNNKDLEMADLKNENDKIKSEYRLLLAKIEKSEDLSIWKQKAQYLKLKEKKIALTK